MNLPLKKILMTSIFGLGCLFDVLAYNLWIDPDTGIKWAYVVTNGEACVGTGDYFYRAVNTSTSGDIVVPSVLGECPVTRISGWAFNYCESLRSVRIPSGVKTIDYDAFYYCRRLTNVVLSVGLTNVGSLAFAECVSLQSITLPDGVDSIGSMAFSGCKSLKYVSLPTSVKSIGSGAFYGCAGLGEGVISFDGCILCVNGDCPEVLALPIGTRLIAGGAFSGDTNLTSVTLPMTVEEVGDNAFCACSKLNCFIVDSANAYFTANEGALLNKSMTRLLCWPGGRGGECTIPYGVREICQCAFMNNVALSGVFIPSSVETIGFRAFYGCEGLLDIAVPYGVKEISNEAFYACKSLTNVVISSCVESIGDRAFCLCNGLKNIILSGNVRRIGREAFKDCNCESLLIPATVESIGNDAFHNNYGALKALSFEGAPPSGIEAAGILKSAEIRYNIAYSSEWTAVIDACGFTNATPYVPDLKPVVFVAGNGQSSILSQYYTNVVYGVLPEARRTGCTFAGWYTSLDGTNRVSAFSAVDPAVKTLYARWVEDEATLYAQWEANQYSVIFDAQGGAGVMGAQPFVYDQRQALSGNAFTRTGYTFKGWATNEAGEVVYADGQSVSNLTAEAGFAVALFAKWEKVIDVLPEEIEEWVGYSLAPKFKKLGETATAYRKRFEEKFGDDYTVAFFTETGKIGQDGTRLQVWHDYVAGTDPLNEDDKFTAIITIEDGVVKVDYSPKFEDVAEADRRLYKKWGKVRLQDAAWIEVPDGRNADYNFFKVTVEMKTQP